MRRVTPSVGVIGGGVIGAAHANVFRHYCDVKVFDVDPARRSHEWHEVAAQDVLFLCVPTPMKRDGKVESHIVYHELARLREQGAAKVVILKSTLPPVELEICWGLLSDRGPTFVFNPEFLTERTAEYDLQQSTRFIFGTASIRGEILALVERLFDARFPLVPRHWVALETAALVKYFTNVFFATKVALLNEFSAVCASFGAPADVVRNLVRLDPRIGNSHFEVPGHDGKPGFGGVCFLKDMQGYLHLAREGGCDPQIVSAAWRSNVRIRGAETIAQELSALVGRAVVDPISAEEVEKL